MSAAPSGSDGLLVDDPRPGVRRLRLDRPSKRNALSRALVQRLITALDVIDVDQTVRAVVLAASGPSFCAGADLSEHFLGTDDPPDIGASGLWDRLEGLRVPVVAAVQGHAVTGGFLLAYCCDLIVAADDAVFRDTHAQLGLVPTGGETQRLPRRIGAFRARELLLTSRPMGAEEAHRIGLVAQVVARVALDAAALDLAAQIVANDARSTRVIKQMIAEGLRADLEAGLQVEQHLNRGGAINLEPGSGLSARLTGFREDPT